MADQEDPSKIFGFNERIAKEMINNADSELEMALDLLADTLKEDPIDLRATSLLCDSVSSNYHVWRIMRTNLKHNLVKKEKENIVAISETDLLLAENAVLAKVFTKKELLKLNYSLTLH